MVEMLKQPQFKPMNVIDQVMIIFAGTSGGSTRWTARRCRRGRSQFLNFMKEQKPEVRDLLAKEKKITDEE